MYYFDFVDAQNEKEVDQISIGDLTVKVTQLEDTLSSNNQAIDNLKKQITLLQNDLAKYADRKLEECYVKKIADLQRRLALFIYGEDHASLDGDTDEKKDNEDESQKDIKEEAFSGENDEEETQKDLKKEAVSGETVMPSVTTMMTQTSPMSTASMMPSTSSMMQSTSSMMPSTSSSMASATQNIEHKKKTNRKKRCVIYQYIVTEY